MLNVIANLDTSAYLLCNRLQKASALTSVFRAISHTGDGHLYALSAPLLFLLKVDQHLPFIQTALLAFLIELPCFVILKRRIRRDRPFKRIANCKFAIQPSDLFSMPSGHTAAAFLMAALAAAHFPDYTVAVYSWATLIGFSRVLLGVHYPGDILAGAALGFVCSAVAMAIMEVPF